jgi:hypothetical protein
MGVQPPKSGNLKLSELYVVGTPNLCPETPGTMRKESAQSDHPAQRKRLKCGPILLVYGNVKILQ